MDLKQLTTSVSRFFQQYQTVIIAVTMSTLLALAIFRLYYIVTISTQTGVDGYAPKSKTIDTFNQDTIDRVNNLKTVDQDSSTFVPPARKSPFVE